MNKEHTPPHKPLNNKGHIICEAGKNSNADVRMERVDGKGVCGIQSSVANNLNDRNEIDITLKSEGLRNNTVEKDSEGRKRHRIFLPKWQDNRPWLKTVVENDIIVSMHCVICRKYPLKPTGPGKPNEAFIKGSTNFRLEAVVRHEYSLGHQKAKEMCEDEGFDYVGMERDGKAMMHNTVKFVQIYPIVRNVHAMVLHGRAFSDCEWLCQLDEAKGIQVAKHFQGSRHVEMFVHHIASAEREKVKGKVRSSRFVSLLVDSISDDSTKNEELLYLRTVEDGRVDTFFIGGVNTSLPINYEDTYSAMYTSTLENYINLSEDCDSMKLVGFSVNQSTFSTRTGGAFDFLQNTRLPWILGVHYEISHLEQTIKNILGGIRLYGVVHQLLWDVYHYYRNPLNRASLKVITFANSNKHKILKVIPPDPYELSDLSENEFHEDDNILNNRSEYSKTGERTSDDWMTCTLTAVQSLVSSYSDIVCHCKQSLSESEARTSEVGRTRKILERLYDRDTVLFLHLLWDLLEEIVPLFKQLRDTESCIHTMYTRIKAVVENIHSYASSGGQHLTDAVRQLATEGKYQGIELLQSSGYAFEGERLELMTALKGLLESIFKDVNSQVLNATVIAELSQWPQTLSDDIEFGDDCIKALLNHFKPVLEAAKVKVQRVEVEWNSIKMHIYNSSTPVHQRTWADIHSSVGKKFGNFLALIDLILAVPSYSSIRERGSKVAKQMKSDWRKALNFNLKTDIMCTILHSGSVKDFDPKRTVELWSKSTGIELQHKTQDATNEDTQPTKEADNNAKENARPNAIASCQMSNNCDPKTYKFECNLCMRLFRKETDMIKHKSTHIRRRCKGIKGCKCPICQKSFKNKPSLSAHISIQHRRKGEHVPPLNAGRVRKVREKRSVVQTTCNLCNNNFSSGRTLRHHRLIYHQLSPYKCKICQKCFHGKTALVEHNRCHTGERPYKCSVCDKRFRRMTDAKEHVNTHDESRQRYSCSYCIKTFTQKIHLKYHTMTHTNEYRYYCDQCGKGFQMNCLLVRHKIRAHTHLKPFKCTKCPKSFKTSRDLKIHVDSHDPSKNYICNQCGKMFQSRHLVEGHVLRMHEKEKLPLQCITCGKRFRHPTMLAAHERIHTGETPFQCHTCGKTFKQKGHLTAHTRTHTGERPYSCPICNTKFTVSCSLKKHMKYVHEGVKRKSNKEGKQSGKALKQQVDHFESTEGPAPLPYTQTAAMNQINRQVDNTTTERHFHDMQTVPLNPMNQPVEHISQLPVQDDSSNLVPNSQVQCGSVSNEPIQSEQISTCSIPQCNAQTTPMSAYWFMGGHYQHNS